TDPTKEDTDGDGISDSAEINLGSDPTDENDVPNVVGRGLTISINIAGGNANSPSAGGAGGEGIVTGNAGLGQLGNWNNAVGASNVGDGLTVPALVNSTGSATAASFSWVTNNTWSTSSADGAGTDQDMLSGYLDNFHANGSITVAGLGPEFTGPGYDVLVYYQTDNSNMTAGFTVADNAGNTDTRFGHQVAVNNWPLAGGELTDGYIISTEAEGNTLFSANIVQLSGFSGSDFTMTGNGGSVGSARARPSGIQIISLGGAEPLPLEVSGRDMLTFRWPSQRGQLYTLRSETDPSVADPIDWPVFDGHQDMEATPPENTLTIPRPPEAKRFFVIEGFAAPPESIFADDFEGGQGGWTTGTEGAVGTMWELGLPGVGPAAANSPTSCFGTNLTAGYAIDADVWLRSPPIDLTAVAGATVNYFQAFDIEETFDLGRVSVIDCADDSVLAVIEDDLDGVSLDWALVSRVLPPQVVGKIVKIEFRLITDVFDGSVFAGWYLDDFMVTVP
ncbi:MAG: hypothetical protein OSB65_18980, partial [Roseibacillus sp.]|nr:hypothetical protein [Roseibacillus sp.]